MTASIPTEMKALMLAGPRALTVETVPVPRPKPGEVLIRMAASPVNPSDLMTVLGEYGIAAQYPFTPGLEGSGVVVAGKGALARFSMGKRVACASASGGMWAEYAIAPSGGCIPLPAEVSLGAGAMSAVNPLTALALLTIARQGRHRAAISTAAGGQLGRMIRKRGEEVGVQIINIVRRPEQVAELEADGARHVLCEADPEFDVKLKDLCKTLNCRLAFDAVGGGTTFRLAEAMRPGAEIHVYGALAQKAVSLHPGTMIFKEVTVKGFWLSKWLPRKGLLEVLRYARQATMALKDGFAVSEVARVVDLGGALDGIRAYEMGMSLGKTLIRPGDADLGLSDAG